MTSAVPSSSSRGRGRRVLIGALSGALVAGGIVVATTASAPASATNAFSDLITLQTGATNEAVFYPSNPAASTTTQTITTSACRLTSDDSVVKFTGGPGRVGLRQGSIGIINNGTGESCGQLNGSSEFLNLSLNGNLATKAVLDIELQKDAVVLATLTNGSTETYVELQTGQSITSNGSSRTAASRPSESTVTVATCQAEQSSAANSGPNDNCRWVIDDAQFTGIELKAIIGNASLEGGADGTVTRLSRDANTGTTDTEPLPAASALSYFMLRDTFNCGPDDRITIPSTATTIGGSVERFGNASGSTCVGFQYDVRPTDKGIELIKKQTTPAQNDIQLLFRLEFDADEPIGSVPPIKFQFHNNTGTLSTTTINQLPWCQAPFVGIDGAITGITSADVYNSAAVQGLDLETGTGFPGVQWACVGEPDLTYVNGIPDKVIQPVYVLGDAFPRR